VVNENVRRAVANVFGEDVADEIITLTEKQVEVAGGVENGAKLLGMQLLILDNLFSQHGRGDSRRTYGSYRFNYRRVAIGGKSNF